jgi:hypothetical protein
MSGARVRLVETGQPHDVFELVELAGGVARVRTAFLFEIGEELKLEIERDGTRTEVVARVRAHVGDGDTRVTELEL